MLYCLETVSPPTPHSPKGALSYNPPLIVSLIVCAGCDKPRRPDVFVPVSGKITRPMFEYSQL